MSASQVVSTESRTISDVRMEIEALDPNEAFLVRLYIAVFAPFSNWDLGDYDASQDCNSGRTGRRRQR